MRRILIPLILVGLIGCSTSSENLRQTGSSNRTIERGSASKKEIQRYQRKYYAISEEIAKILKSYGKPDPSMWKTTTTYLQKLEDDQIPAPIQELSKQAMQKGKLGKNVRSFLHKNAKIAQIIFQLPSKNYEDWKSVRKNVSKYGPKGKQLLIEYLFQYLKKQKYKYRTHATKTLAKLGGEVVQINWKYMKNVAKNARKQSRNENPVEGSMIVLRGMAEVLLHFNNKDLIQKAANHSSVRIRTALAFSLGNVDSNPIRRETLKQLSVEDPSPYVRLEAISSLKRLKNPDTIPFLVRSLNDPVQENRNEAKDALRSFPEREKVIEALTRWTAKLRMKKQKSKHISSFLNDLQ